MTALDITRAVEAIVNGVTTGSGATVSAIAGVATPTKGYAVSLPGYERIHRFEDLRSYLARGMVDEAARHFIDAHRAILASDPTLYVGAWVDGDRLVFDVSRIHSALADAVAAGVAADQDAIYSFETQTALTLTHDDSDVITAERGAVNWALRDIANLTPQS